MAICTEALLKNYTGIELSYNILSRGVEILLVTPCYRNQDKFQPDKPLGWYADSLITLRSWIVLEIKSRILSESGGLILYPSSSTSNEDD